MGISHKSTNPAALAGWVKSADPRSGRTFYANHITRKTQWDAPDNWIEAVEEEDEDDGPPPFSAVTSGEIEEPLPSNWEQMQDPTTGKYFYVDHERKITTWTRPTASTNGNSKANVAASSTLQRILSSQRSGELEPYGSSSSSVTKPTSTAPVSSFPKGSAYDAPYRPSASQQPSYSAVTTSSPAAYHSSSAAAAATSRSYQHEATYYSNLSSSSSNNVDFSDALPALDFKVLKVQDALRPNCPHCKAVFSLSKRRHHCRLCGDVFCDPCSDHRVSLPLEGSEFEKPVRVCDFCFTDVNAGNFFSMRRYLTPLQLYQGQEPDSTETNNVATSANVNAALHALSNDLDQMMHNASSFEERVTIPAHILVPCLTQHLERIGTRDRAMVALASLLALGSLVGKCDFAHAVYQQKRRQQIMDDILTLLERSGSDRKTLYVQEQAARTIYYLTEPDTLKRLLQNQSSSTNNGDYDPDEDHDDPTIQVRALDLHRTLRNMLDHSSMSKNPNLQRWSAATIRNLIAEDERRTCMALNEQAGALATGETSNAEYESFLDSLVGTGGIMILCSLMGTEDADTRAHAMGSLGAVLSATRAIQASRNALAEMTGGRPQRNKRKPSDEEGVSTVVLRAIVASGGCGSSVSQLLLSADNVVATMGCNFCASLVVPILTNPRGSATLPHHYDCTNPQNRYVSSDDNDDDEDLDLDACREAALEMATGSCLPALLSLVRDSSVVSRPMELKKSGMETLAAISVAVGEMGKSWADGMYEEGIMENAEAPNKLKEAISHLNDEGIVAISVEVLQASQSLGATGKDTPTARLREAAGIVLACMTSCSAEAIMECSNNMSTLLAVDASMTTPSALRGDAAPKCIGLLEAAAAVLIFAWQNHSGAASTLLDRLIDVIDSGAVGYLSRVLAIPTDWDAKDKAVGGMKAKTAACKLLCAMFGIANHNNESSNADDDNNNIKSIKSTSIGLRRLMEAVDADSYAYRTSRDKNAPSNIMEAALATLYTASIHARNSLMGQSSSRHGAHYHAALMDLLEAAVLASSSMCGSSIAPGGDHGTFVKGDQFLTNRKDEFQKRRQDACKIACDVVIRGGKGGPALLPAMLVGGYGEGTVLASLRLALAIAQNGNQEQHAKLALCGLLVPISDLLRTALDRGDLYKFSASLALVRFCGPHIASGEGGGLASVQDAIRVATTVLTMPLNPQASEEQVEVQDALKSECISAVESLSSNASLWTCISKDALPAIVYYLHSSCDLSESTTRRRETRCAALRAVLKIVQVPSHAVAAAEAGLPEPLGIMLKNGTRKQGGRREEEVFMLSLEVLHVLASNRDSRRAAQLIDNGILRAVCSTLGSAATDKVNKPTDTRADITFLGLEIVHMILSDVEGIGTAEQVLQSQAAVAFLDSVAAEASFIQALCATLLLKTNMKIRRNDAVEGEEGSTFDIPKMYGPPLVLVQEKCGGFANTHEAARAILFTLSAYACAIDSRRSQTFWKTVLLDGVKDEDEPPERASAALCSHFLSLLSDDAGPFVPADPKKVPEYERIRRPLVRHRLLEGLMSCLSAATPSYGEPDIFMLSLLVHFGLPQICLALWKDPALLEISFGLIETMVKMDPDEVIPLFVESKPAMLSLFDLLNLNKSSKSTLDANEVRRFLASVLGTLADNGLLTQAVQKHGVRSSAIGALAAACLMEEETSNDDEEEMASSRLSSGLMKCLVDICSVQKDGASAKRKIELSSFEAEAIAQNLGKKVCQMVILRFIERAKLQQYEMEEDEDIMDAPDVAMLCAVAQHEAGLTILRSLGGLHALSLIAAEGEPAAIAALKMASKDNPNMLLEADGHLSVLALFSSENGSSSWRSKPEAARRLETAAFDLLAQLCAASQKGRQAVSVADHFSESLNKAVEIISGLLPRSVCKEESAPEAADEEADEQVDTAMEKDNDDDAETGDDATGPTTDQEAGDSDSEDENEEKISEREKNKPQPTAIPTKKEAAIIERSDDSPKDNTSDIITLPFPDSLLEVAAIGFVSSLIQIKSIRNEIIANQAFVRSCCALAVYFDDSVLQQEAVLLLVKLAPFASSEELGFALSNELLATTFLSILTSDHESKAKEAATSARLQGRVVSGLLCIFDCITPNTQVEVLRQVVSKLTSIIKACAVSRTAKSDVQRGRDIGELACNMSYLMLHARGVLLAGKVASHQLLVTLAHVIQWRFDPKTTLQDAELQFWNATVTHCVLLVSTLVIGSQQSLDATGIKLADIPGIVLMVARPGKAPRKAIDFCSALQKLIEVGDAAAAVAAQRILDRLAA